MTDKSDTRPPGWGIVLVGHPADLYAWHRALEPSFDPRIEIVEGVDPPEHVLRCAEFDAAGSAEAARSLAIPLVAQLNGAVGAISASEPVKVGNVIQFTEDGKLHRTIIGEMGSIRLRGDTVLAIGVAIGSDGVPIPPPLPQRSQAQRWADAADADDDIADLLVHFGRAHSDWYEIYKTLEVAKRLGNRLGGYNKLLRSEADAVENVRVTANAYRHSRKGTYRPPVMVPLADAVPIVRWVVKIVMDAASI